MLLQYVFLCILFIIALIRNTIYLSLYISQYHKFIAIKYPFLLPEIAPQAGVETKLLGVLVEFCSFTGYQFCSSSRYYFSVIFILKFLPFFPIFSPPFPFFYGMQMCFRCWDGPGIHHGTLWSWVSQLREMLFKNY